MTAVLPLCRPGRTRWIAIGMADLPVARRMLSGTQRLIASMRRTRLVSVAAQSAEKVRLSSSSLS
jgi:hypothetical protein